MSELAITNVTAPEYTTSTSGNSGSNGTQSAPSGEVLGADDKVELKKSNMPKLTPILYEIKEGDSLSKIASELGLNMTDLVDQLKASGKLPKDYDPNVRHKHDISWMKKGNKIKISYPATEKQKEEYEEFCEKRTREFYNKKAAEDRKKKADEKAKAKAEYDALPWYKQWFTKEP